MHMGEPVLDAENAPSRNMDEARDEAMARLFAAHPLLVGPSVRESVDLNAVTDAAIELGTQILLTCPKGREQSLALTHLEDALTRARRALLEATL